MLDLNKFKEFCKWFNKINKILFENGKPQNFISVSLVAILSSCTTVTAELKTKATEIPLTKSALQILHVERHNTGGFSALSLSSDCSQLITISDYSQADNSKLDKPVRRSGWYQAQTKFNQDGSLKGLDFNKKGQLKDLDGSIIQGATESMAKEKNGFLISFDDKGTIYRYTATKQFPNALDNIPTVAYKQKNLGHGNFGLEAIARLNNGSLLAFWETERDHSIALGRLLKANGDQVDVKFMADSSPGGATKLSDGSVLILEKRWLGKEGQRIRLVRIMAEQLDSTKLKTVKAPIKGVTLLDDIGTEYDNNEGISSCVRDGKEWVYVITDDNGDWPRRNVEDKGKKRQRTLLMQYDLEKLLRRE